MSSPARLITIAVLGGFAVGGGLGLLRLGDGSAKSETTSQPAYSLKESAVSGAKGFAKVEDAVTALFTANQERQPLRRQFELYEVIQRLNAEQAAELGKRVHKLGGQTSMELLDSLMRRWAELDLEGASAWMAPKIRRGFVPEDSDAALVSAWVSVNPKGMMKEALVRPHANMSAVFLVDAIKTLAPEDTVRQLELLSELPESALRHTALSSLLALIAGKDPGLALNHAWRLGDKTKAIGLRELAIRALAAKDPAGAISRLADLVPEFSTDRHGHSALRLVVFDTSKSDPKAMLDWLSSQTEEVAESLRPAVAIGWASHDPIAALNWAHEHGVTIDANVTNNPSSRGQPTLFDIALRKDEKAVIDWIRALPESDERERMRLNAMRQLDPVLAKEMFADVREKDRTEAAIIVTALIDNSGDKGAMDWAMSLPPGEARRRSIELAARREAPRSAINDAAEAVERFTNDPDRDAALHGWVTGMAYKQPSEAIEAATAIRDEGIRERALWQVAADWSRRDTHAAAEWIESNTLLSAESKSALIRHLRDRQKEFY